MRVEMIPGNHCDFSIYLTKRARTQSGACAEVQFPDYGKVLWSPASSNIIGKHCDFITYLAKRERELRLAHSQKYTFLIMEQCCGPLAVLMIP
jgi:hypothetical protein